MKIINRTSIGIDVKGFVLDQEHVHISRAHEYHLGKKFGAVLELGGFEPDELRSIHSTKKMVEVVEGFRAELPPEELDRPEFARLWAAVQSHKEHLSALPSLELLEQFEAEEEDGFYLYPKDPAS